MLNSDAVPGSHEWAPCVRHEFPTFEAFKTAMKIMADRNFFVVRFMLRGVESASRYLPRLDAYCNRSSWGRLYSMRVHVTVVFNFTCLLHNYFEGISKEAVYKNQTIKCGCDYFVQLRKPSREPNTPWKIMVCKLQHTNGCNPTKSSHLACTQRGKKQWVPVLDALVGQIGEVQTSAVTRANLLQVPCGFAGVRNYVHVS